MLPRPQRILELWKKAELAKMERRRKSTMQDARGFGQSASWPVQAALRFLNPLRNLLPVRG